MWLRVLRTIVGSFRNTQNQHTPRPPCPSVAPLVQQLRELTVRREVRVGRRIEDVVLSAVERKENLGMVDLRTIPTRDAGKTGIVGPNQLMDLGTDAALTGHRLSTSNIHPLFQDLRVLTSNDHDLGTPVTSRSRFQAPTDRVELLPPVILEVEISPDFIEPDPFSFDELDDFDLVETELEVGQTHRCGCCRKYSDDRSCRCNIRRNRCRSSISGRLTTAAAEMILRSVVCTAPSAVRAGRRRRNRLRRSRHRHRLRGLVTRSLRRRALSLIARSRRRIDPRSVALARGEGEEEEQHHHSAENGLGVDPHSSDS